MALAVIFSAGFGLTLNQMVAEAQTSVGTYLEIKSNTDWSGSVLDSGFDSATQSGSGFSNIPVDCSQGMGIYSAVIQKQGEYGYLTVSMIKDGSVLDTKTTYAAYGVVMISGRCD